MSATTKKQTLKQALYLAATGKGKALARAARALDGLPEGGWGDTHQALRRIADDLPGQWARAYTTTEWVEATHEIVPDPKGQGAGTYRARDLGGKSQATEWPRHVDIRVRKRDANWGVNGDYMRTCLVEEDGTVRAHDSLAGHYTLAHGLSDEQVERARAAARADRRFVR